MVLLIEFNPIMQHKYTFCDILFFKLKYICEQFCNLCKILSHIVRKFSIIKLAKKL